MTSFAGPILAGCLICAAGVAAAAVPTVHYQIDGQGHVVGWTESTDQVTTDYDGQGHVIRQTVRSATGTTVFGPDGRPVHR